MWLGGRRGDRRQREKRKNKPLRKTGYRRGREEKTYRREGESVRDQQEEEGSFALMRKKEHRRTGARGRGKPKKGAAGNRKKIGEGGNLRSSKKKNGAPEGQWAEGGKKGKKDERNADWFGS